MTDSKHDLSPSVSPCNDVARGEHSQEEQGRGRGCGSGAGGGAQDQDPVPLQRPGARPALRQLHRHHREDQVKII